MHEPSVREVIGEVIQKYSKFDILFSHYSALKGQKLQPFFILPAKFEVLEECAMREKPNTEFWKVMQRTKLQHYF